MQEITSNTHLQLNPEVAYTLIDNEAVLMKPASDALFEVNSVGVEILNRLSHQSCSFLSLVEHLTQQFQVEEEICSKDTIAFLNLLLKENIIVVN